MIVAVTAPPRSRFTLSGLVFPLSLPLALLNGLALFFMASWSSVPAHHAVPDGQALPTPEAAAAAGLPYWGLLILIAMALMASIAAALGGQPRLARRLAGVQFIPVALLAGATIVSPFL
ncbi:hypothetical protein [Brevundimonas sp. LjRoot202]|uniref:hypothetical protein n=1 Tax=Brevundimonas sp. LjRoot202 TaxID=3342281 RepID=UPI003ECFDFDD